MPFPASRVVISNHAKRVFAAILAAVAAIAGVIAPVSPASAEVGAPTCAHWVFPTHCVTYLRGDSPDLRVGDITSWATLGDKVDYWTSAASVPPAINKISVAGNSQSCTYKSTSSGISTAKPIKVTQIDTFSFSTVGFGFSFTSAGTATVTANATKTEFSITTVATNAGCTSASYALTFIPDGIGYIYRLTHRVSTTYDWGNGKTVTNGTLDDTSLRT
ncbi:hypothetical protein ACFO0M_27615 [Micromonospora mangrovi]|uniref:Uncharacterized protein n=2 Tax=Micromonospora TaxID=1873 RepID=A0AAU7ME48_9ACTN